MYRVRLESKQEGRKGVKKVESLDMFPTIEKAHEFIDSCIKQQEQTCWKAWGLEVTDIKKSETTVTATYQPAIIFYRNLVQKFDIIPA